MWQDGTARPMTAVRAAGYTSSLTRGEFVAVGRRDKPTLSIEVYLTVSVLWNRLLFNWSRQDLRGQGESEFNNVIEMFNLYMLCSQARPLTLWGSQKALHLHLKPRMRTRELSSCSWKSQNASTAVIIPKFGGKFDSVCIYYFFSVHFHPLCGIITSNKVCVCGWICFVERWVMG